MRDHGFNSIRYLLKMTKVFLKHLQETFFGKWFRKNIIHPCQVNIWAINRISDHVPCWKYIEISSLRMFEVMAMIGVWSNCLIKWQADTPSKLGMIISINTRSYFDPALIAAFILSTASRPSN